MSSIQGINPHKQGSGYPWHTDKRNHFLFIIIIDQLYADKSLISHVKNRNACYYVIKSIFKRALKSSQMMFSRELHVSLAKRSSHPDLEHVLLNWDPCSNLCQYSGSSTWKDLRTKKHQKNTKKQLKPWLCQSQFSYSFLFDIISGEWLHVHLAYASLHKLSFQSVHHATPAALSPSCFSLSVILLVHFWNWII